jgi:hypothetical protein
MLIISRGLTHNVFTTLERSDIFYKL